MRDPAAVVRNVLRWIVYLGGWSFAFVAPAPVLGLMSFVKTLPVELVYLMVVVVMLVAPMPFIAMAMRVAHWVSVGRPFLPVAFSGWRFGITAIGVGASVLAVGITLLFFSASKGSGMSGVPAGMVILGSSVFGLLGIAASEIDDWRNSPRMLVDAPFDATPMMNDAEMLMHQRLVEVLPECLVFAKVRMPGLVSVRPGHDAIAWYDRVSRLSVDFVVCLKDSSVVVAAVELQTDEDFSRKAMRNFERKEQALKAAGVPLLRWSALNLPDEAEIRTAFTQ